MNTKQIMVFFIAILSFIAHGQNQTSHPVGFTCTQYDNSGNVIQVDTEPYLYAAWRTNLPTLDFTQVYYHEKDSNDVTIRGKIWNVKEYSYSELDSTATIKISTEDNKVWDIILYYTVKPQVKFIYNNSYVIYTGVLEYGQ